MRAFMPRRRGARPHNLRRGAYGKFCPSFGTGILLSEVFFGLRHYSLTKRRALGTTAFSRFSP